MKSNWNYPTTVWVGENRVSDLSKACKNLSIKRPMFVTDKDLVNLPFVKKMVSNHKSSSLITIIDSGHVVNIDQSEQFNTSLLSHLLMD